MSIFYTDITLQDLTLVLTQGLTQVLSLVLTTGFTQDFASGFLQDLHLDLLAPCSHNPDPSHSLQNLFNFS